MGACASRPKDLDRDLAPAPVPVEESATSKGDAVPQEKKDGEETKKEEPLIDLPEAAEEAPESTETKAVVEAEGDNKEETAKPAEEDNVEAAKEELTEQQPADETAAQ